MKPTSYEYRDPAELTIHAAIKAQPRLALDDPKMIAWRKGMKRSGPDAHEVLITADNQIVDGRHWVWNAKSLQWPKVRVQVVADEDVLAIVMATLIHRRHYTKGQLAFIMAPHVDLNANRHNQLAGLKQGDAIPVANSVRNGKTLGISAVDLSEQLGTSVRIIQQALDIRELFAADKTKRTMTDRDDVTEKGVTLEEFFTPRILMEEDPEAPRTRAYGLGAVLAGIKAVVKMAEKETPHGGGRPQNVQKQLDLFEDSLKGVKAKYVYWEKWEPETQQVALAELPPFVEGMPDGLFEGLVKVVKTEAKRRGGDK